MTVSGGGIDKASENYTEGSGDDPQPAPDRVSASLDEENDVADEGDEDEEKHKKGHSKEEKQPAKVAERGLGRGSDEKNEQHSKD